MTQRKEEVSPSTLVAALAIGSLVLFVLGVQPILRGKLLEAKQVRLAGLGLMAAEVAALGLKVVFRDLALSSTQLRFATTITALVAAAFDATVMLTHCVRSAVNHRACSF